jgi:hypothetical protein
MSIDFNAKSKFRKDETIGEYIRCVDGELPIDAVGLWQIIPYGREGFELLNDELVEFTKLCILSLLNRGAVPVLGGRKSHYEWIYQPQYGKIKDEIINSIINEWLNDGAKDPDPGGLWFALPSLEFPFYVGFLTKWLCKNSNLSIDINKKNKFSNQTILEYAQEMSNSLQYINICFMDIVIAGRKYFELTDNDLIDFLQFVLFMLLECGAKPALKHTINKQWIAQYQYGETDEKIVNGIINKWLTVSNSNLEFLVTRDIILLKY